MYIQKSMNILLSMDRIYLERHKILELYFAQVFLLGKFFRSYVFTTNERDIRNKIKKYIRGVLMNKMQTDNSFFSNK